MRSRSYDKEFKLNAIELYKNGKSGTNVCKDLGIPDSTFWGWLKQYQTEGSESFTGSGSIKPANKDCHELQRELDDVKMERDILKSFGHLFKTKVMIFDFMRNHSNEFEIKKMAKVFKVSRAGYYRYINKKESLRQQANKDLTKKITVIHKQNREVYGSPRIHAILKSSGEKCSRKRVAMLMKRNNIQAKSIKKWRVSNKACKDITKIAPNIVNQKFEAPMPNQVWVSDITYIRTNEGWLYVAAIMDVHSRKIVGLSMSDRIDTNLIGNAFRQAVCHRSPRPGLILHSDRGVQYTSHEYKHITQVQGALLSMSAKGYCYDNAAMESFFHTLKTEHVYFCKYQTRKDAAHSIFEYIEVFYNRQRIHSALNYLSPLKFEQQNELLCKKIGAVG